MPHRYYFLSRPPGIGCQPDGFANREYWRPKQEIPGTERTAHGWVEYPEKLTAEQVEHWSFWIADVLERAEYVFAGKDWLRENYLSQPIEKLREYADEHRDLKAWAALVILEKGGKDND